MENNFTLTELDKMTYAFQYKSKFYFCGETAVERAIYWKVFKEGWMLAKESMKEENDSN